MHIFCSEPFFPVIGLLSGDSDHAMLRRLLSSSSLHFEGVVVMCIFRLDEDAARLANEGAADGGNVQEFLEMIML